MMFRTGGLLLSVVAGAALLTGCGEDEPPTPVEYGAARPAGDTLGLRPPEGSALPLAEWPDACKLVTEAELRAIVPRAKALEHEPVKVTIMNFNPLAEAVPGTTGDVDRGGCTYDFHLPDHGDDEFANSHFTVVVTAIADPALVEKNYREDKDEDGTEKGYTDLAGSWGAEDCYLTAATGDDEVTCLQGAYLFEVDGDTSAAGVVDMPDPGAKASENLAAAAERRRLWTEEVLAEVTRTVAARLS
ncbi:hypothetical protein [Streptomyces sp. V2I9]|uniref:hypothetical protein n=1 Tax=Streptomyces sp. V2I9 TaxID=3042304 RepID=UPI00278297D1|nr:hypothetical protein [Streptomyces sp. V2I9]MDQ0988528.1 hypothetical protein [Streptomyces sp. V2I9]